MAWSIGKAATEAALAAMPTDLRDLAREALIALEAATLSLEMLARHGITESSTFDQVVEHVGRATDAVLGIEAALTSTPTTIFPNLSMARDWCQRHPLSEGRFYQIHPDGMGRCSVSISQIVEHL